MNGLSHVVRQRITSVRFRGRSSKAGFQIARIKNRAVFIENRIICSPEKAAQNR